VSFNFVIMYNRIRFLNQFVIMIVLGFIVLMGTPDATGRVPLPEPAIADTAIRNTPRPAPVPAAGSTGSV